MKSAGEHPLDCLSTHSELADDVGLRVAVGDEAFKERATLLRELLSKPGVLLRLSAHLLDAAEGVC